MTCRLLVVVLACCVFAGTPAYGKDNSHTLYLIRHAEKQADGSRDPMLSKTGSHRAEQLADWFKNKNIEDIWSSDYHRTRDTVKPLVTMLGLELSIYDPRNLPDLASKLTRKQTTAVIVGHSNTTPDLARLLCDCPIEDMEESEYDRLVIVKVGKDQTRVSVLRQGQLFQP